MSQVLFPPSSAAGSGLLLHDGAPAAGAAAVPARPALLLGDGDSLMNGYNPSSTQQQGQDPLRHCLSLHGGGWVGLNIAVSGRTAATCAGNAATAYAAAYAAARPYHALAILAGTNDLYASVSAADVYDDLVTCVDAALAVGFDRVLVLTPLNRKDAGTPGGFDTARQSLRSLILAGVGDYLAVDTGGDTRIGLTDSPDDTVYFHSDKLHLSALGYGVMAQLMAAVLFDA